MKDQQDVSVGGYFLHSLSLHGPQSTFIRHALGYQYTYQDTVEKVARILQFFEKEQIRKGDRIVCYWEEPIPAILFTLACAISGVILVPLSPIFSVFYLKNLMAQNGAKAAFTTLDRMSLLKEGGLSPHCSDEFTNPELAARSEEESNESSSLPQLSFETSLALLEKAAAQIHSDDIFMIQPTSGSTGQPKLVMRPHMAPARYAINVGPILESEGGERPRFLMVAALTHAFGFHMLTTALSLGAELLLPSRIDAAAPLGEVQELDPTVVPLVPRILRSFFLQKDNRKGNPACEGVFGPGIKFLISAGGSGDPSYFQNLRDRGVQIIEIYGSSEASIVAMTPKDGWRAGFAGKVLPDVEVKVEEDGELLIRSPGIMSGYFQDEQATAEAFTEDGYYRSGDLGQIDTQNYLQILGRKKDIYNTAEGSNIYPERIENLLESLPMVKQAILLGDRLPYMSALLVLHSNMMTEAQTKQVSLDGSLKETVVTDLYKTIGQELRKINSRLERPEQIVRFALFAEPFHPDTYTTVGAGKARRNRKQIQTIYSEQIKDLYYASKVLDNTFVPGMDRRLRPHSELRVHLIWATKDHKPLIREDVAQKVKPMLKELCLQMNVRILSGSVSSNHVHLFVSYPPELSISEIVSKLKHSTSERIFHLLPIVREEAQGKNLWDQGYLAVTSGNLEGDLIERFLAADEGLASPLLEPVKETSIVIPLSQLNL